MRVLLRDDVQGVGRRGDIVSVSDGYARNFLFPNGQALQATDGMEGQAAAMRRGRDLRNARSEEAARTVAQVLNGVVVTIPARAGATGRLFGSVGAHDIARAVKDQKGVELEVDAVALDEPIKALGSVEVPIQLFGDVAVQVVVEVTAAD
jgi:large subunit ribosomal protein L9